MDWFKHKDMESIMYFGVRRQLRLVSDRTNGINNLKGPKVLRLESWLPLMDGYVMVRL